jgi:hypothetical protein
MIDQEDFYIENGFYVFTEKYHLKRGHCCQSGCRHCPYNQNNTVECTKQNSDKSEDKKNQEN